MPTYEYRCSACDHDFEEFQSITADPIRTCPQCGRKTVKRLIGCGGGLIFKGSGFYQTDYRSEGYKKAAQADKDKKTTTTATAASDSNNSGGSAKTSADNKQTAAKKNTQPNKS